MQKAVSCVIVLACVAAPYFTSAAVIADEPTRPSESSTTLVVAQTKGLVGVLVQYRGLFGEFPGEDKVGRALLGENPQHEVLIFWKDSQVGPDRQLLDVWGRPYAFKFLGKDGVEVRSAGPDGIQGNDDDVWASGAFVEPTPSAPSGTTPPTQ